MELAIGTALGLLTLYLTWYAGRQSERQASHQKVIDAHQSASDWQRDFREWASESIDVLSEAAYACDHTDSTGSDCADQLRSCRARLSALIDRGRLFLPNVPADVGMDKPKAYRGWRHAGLDPLVAAERLISGEVGAGKFKDREAGLIAMKREFVSTVQGILAPDLHNKAIAQLILEAHGTRATDPSLGGLLPSSPSPPTGADRLLWGDAGPPARTNDA